MILAASWLLWSGLYKPLLLGLGLFSCLLVLLLAYRIDFFNKETFSLHLSWRILPYWGWLLKEIVKSSWSVACLVLNPRLPISPTVITLENLPSDAVGQAILGNTITLTPGTLTMDVVEGSMSVHCLTQEGADELLAGGMSQRAKKLMGESSDVYCGFTRYFCADGSGAYARYYGADRL